MQDEFLLTILYMMAGIGGVLFLAYLVWFMRTAESFQEAPLLATCAWISLAGALLCLGSMVTMGALSFDIATPWGSVPSEWFGVCVALGSLAFRYAWVKRRRRRLRGSIV